jgi:O-succinylbenzoic acid--CoA ligase
LSAADFILHPDFKLNGLQFGSNEELLHFADDLQREGDPHEESMGRFLESWLDFNETLPVHTSGSTGEPKCIELEKFRMINSAKATGSYFKLGPRTSALLCLSPDFIAGKMMLVRAMVLGWDLHVVAPERDALVQYDNDYDFVAMVPYQLTYSIEALAKVRKLIVGGSAVPESLVDRLQDLPTEVFATYGMTETITHVAVRRLNGFARSDHYTALPGVKFHTDEQDRLIIEAPQIMAAPLRTNDQVELVSPTSFRWMGRSDNVINSGGIKINPEHLEQKLNRYIDNRLVVTSQPDEVLGERVVLAIENPSGEDIIGLGTAMEKLGKYERPKKIFTLSRFPLTENGKIKRATIRELLRRHQGFIPTSDEEED